MRGNRISVKAGELVACNRGCPVFSFHKDMEWSGKPALFANYVKFEDGQDEIEGLVGDFDSLRCRCGGHYVGSEDGKTYYFHFDEGGWRHLKEELHD